MPRIKRLPKNQLMATAYHEAGHAVAAIRLGIGIGRRGVNIVPSEDAAGSAHVGLGFRGRPDVEVTDRMRVGAEKNVIATFAGEIAQRKFRRSSVRSWHGDSDRRQIIDLLDWFVADTRELEAYARWLYIRAENLFDTPLFWLHVCAVADALIEHKQLKPGEVRAICFREVERRLSRSGGKTVGKGEIPRMPSLS